MRKLSTASLLLSTAFLSLSFAPLSAGPLDDGEKKPKLSNSTTVQSQDQNISSRNSSSSNSLHQGQLELLTRDLLGVITQNLSANDINELRRAHGKLRAKTDFNRYKVSIPFVLKGLNTLDLSEKSHTVKTNPKSLGDQKTDKTLSLSKNPQSIESHLDSVVNWDKLHPHFAKALDHQMKQKGYLFVHEDSPLYMILCRRYKRVYSIDMKKAEKLSRALFGTGLPQDEQSRKDVLDHTIAALPFALFVRNGGGTFQGIHNFWDKHGGEVLEFIKKKKALSYSFQLQPVNIWEKDKQQLASTKGGHNIFVTQRQLRLPEVKGRLEQLFSIAPANRMTLLMNQSEGVLSLQSKDLPASLEHLRCIDTTRSARRVENAFLSGFKGLKTFDTTGLEEVQTVGDYFMPANLSLEEIKLRGLTNILRIGHSFLFNNLSIQEIDFSPLRSIKSIGSFFLRACKSLKKINLKFLSRIRVIPKSFMEECASLEEFDTYGLENVREIGMDFLSECYKLSRVDVNSLRLVRRIEEGFLGNVMDIKTITPKDRSLLPDVVRRNIRKIDEKKNKMKEFCFDF